MERGYGADAGDNSRYPIRQFQRRKTELAGIELPNGGVLVVNRCMTLDFFMKLCIITIIYVSDYADEDNAYFYF